MQALALGVDVGALLDAGAFKTSGTDSG